MFEFGRRFLLAAVLGLAWTQASLWSFIKVHQVTPRSTVGTGLIDCAFLNPVRFAWEAADLPHLWPWHLAPLYAYYAVLTALLWNAGQGRGRFRLAATAYSTHVFVTLLLTLVCGSGVVIPNVDTFYLSNDLVALVQTTWREPATVARFAFCLTVWHAFAIACLARAWATRALSTTA